MRNSDVDEVCAKLSKQYEGKYGKDQLRARSYMINMVMYESYDEASHFGRAESGSVVIELLAANERNQKY